MELRLIPLTQTPAFVSVLIKEEYACCGETCKPFDFERDPNTTLFIVMSDDEVVGVIRRTSYLWNECHGKIGISILPSKRGKGYGYNALSMLDLRGIYKPTACVDECNISSLTMFRKLGYRETGTKYEWKKGGQKRIAVELLAPTIVNCIKEA